MNYQRSYTPMRPIKSFQDLEVYQKLLAISVAVAKRISPPVIASPEFGRDEAISRMVSFRK